MITLLNIVRLTKIQFDAIRNHYINNFIVIDDDTFKLCDVIPNERNSKQPYTIYLRKVIRSKGKQTSYGVKTPYNCNTTCSVNYRGIKLIDDLPTLCKYWQARKESFIE